jgi:hypothetical protein
MTGLLPRVRVHIERVVLHGVPAMSGEALAASIETALADGISGAGGGSTAPGGAEAGAEVGRAGMQVGRAVAPAVLSAAGLTPSGPGGPA